ncbi:hypothetical protein C8A05DRAFT_17970 [Staphylotrichum tortipilum]|uniref:Uncharacterized protein n=1 Tax=Staphylotrichum tortipilum TaxID=2831512 RepID=A0AAN6RQV4_9PEZI|nr:hypothetical protein C8A05DRAFT_17970 [Staphylotrichum longicolle]
MATAQPTTVTLRISRRRNSSSTQPTAAPIPPAGSPMTTTTTNPSCDTHFDFPTKGLTFSHLDTIDVVYRSGLANPTLSCWCGAPGRAVQKLAADHVQLFNGTAPVLLSFLSDDPCWFQLDSSDGDCRYITSEPFRLTSSRRDLRGLRDDDAAAPAIDDRRLAPLSTTTTSSSAPLAARGAAAVDSRGLARRADDISTGAKAALGAGIGVAFICIAVGAMAAFMYFRRRRRGADAEVSGGIADDGRRGGRRGPEKKRHGAASDTSGQSEEPLCPIQPVFDGFPGSMGYEDVRSLHSTVQSHSPTGTQSPATSQNGHFWGTKRSIEREELTAARLKSQLQPSAPSVVSYGPNPVTPTLTPRAAPRLPISSVTTPITPSHTDSPVPPHVPMMPLTDYTDYTHFSIPPPSALPDLKPPPRQPAIPIVVSYGPNRVTPTPLVVSPTVPPDESIVKRRFQEASSNHNHYERHHERQFSWEADSPLLGAASLSMGPLPPYASTEDFEAMEKGAVRKLAAPLAQAELPPTKDGFYHYTSDVVEYELPGSGAGSGSGGNIGGSGGSGERDLGAGGRGRMYQPFLAGGGAGREIDEQKVLLLDDGEIARLKAEKKRARAVAAKVEAEAERGEGGGEGGDLGVRGERSWR